MVNDMKYWFVKVFGILIIQCNLVLFSFIKPLCDLFLCNEIVGKNRSYNMNQTMLFKTKPLCKCNKYNRFKVKTIV